MQDNPPAKVRVPCDTCNGSGGRSSERDQRRGVNIIEYCSSCHGAGSFLITPHHTEAA